MSRSITGCLVDKSIIVLIIDGCVSGALLLDLFIQVFEKFGSEADLDGVHGIWVEDSHVARDFD